LSKSTLSSWNEDPAHAFLVFVRSTDEQHLPTALNKTLAECIPFYFNYSLRRT